MPTVLVRSVPLVCVCVVHVCDGSHSLRVGFFGGQSGQVRPHFARPRVPLWHMRFFLGGLFGYGVRACHVGWVCTRHVLFGEYV